MNFNETVLNYNWWLNTAPSTDRGFLNFGITLAIVFVIIPLFLQIFIKPKFEVTKNLKNDWVRLFGTCEFLLLMLLFFYWQSFPYLGMRLLFGLLGIYFVIRALWLIIYSQSGYKKLLIEEKNQQTLNKYMPKKRIK